MRNTGDIFRRGKIPDRDLMNSIAIYSSDGNKSVLPPSSVPIQLGSQRQRMRGSFCISTAITLVFICQSGFIDVRTSHNSRGSLPLCELRPHLHENIAMSDCRQMQLSPSFPLLFGRGVAFHYAVTTDATIDSTVSCHTCTAELWGCFAQERCNESAVIN